MVKSLSFLPWIGALSLLASVALGSSDVFGRDDSSCNCTPENKVVRYVVVEMPEQTATPTVEAIDNADAIAAPTETAKSSEGGNGPHPGHNSTTTLGPCKNPEIDRSNPENIVPSQKVSLFYGSEAYDDSNSTAGILSGTNSLAPTTPASSINMTLTMNHFVVALEYIGSIVNVDCSDDLLTVKFSDATSFAAAAKNWLLQEDGLVMITNNLGDCDAEFERGFFKVEDVTASESDLTISCTASRQELKAIAEDCEMTFSSLPAATLTKRLTLDPSVSLTFGKSLDEGTVLLDLAPYLNITADEASFTSTITFSGYLHYNFWTFSLTDLYFDIDAAFSADVALSASISAAFTRSFTYSPDALAYYLVDVPGIVSLGPGVAFGIGVDIDASAGVHVHTALGVALPGGNVHVDLLDGDRTSATGWEPVYTAKANISEKATVGADVSASLTVELAIKVLGGLVDLSSGLTAVPRLNNQFTLASTQEIDTTGVSLPDVEGVCHQGISVKSDFLFNLTGFVTKYWSQNLYGVEIPIVDECYEFN